MMQNLYKLQQWWHNYWHANSTTETTEWDKKSHKSEGRDLSLEEREGNNNTTDSLVASGIWKHLGQKAQTTSELINT